MLAGWDQTVWGKILSACLVAGREASKVDELKKLVISPDSSNATLPDLSCALDIFAQHGRYRDLRQVTKKWLGHDKQ